MCVCVKGVGKEVGAQSRECSRQEGKENESGGAGDSAHSLPGLDAPLGPLCHSRRVTVSARYVRLLSPSSSKHLGNIPPSTS